MFDKTLLLYVRLLILLGVIICQSDSTCDENFRKSLLFIRDFADWRKLSFLIMIDGNIKSACHLKIMKASIDTFMSRNIHLSIRSSANKIDETFQKYNYKIGVVSFLESDYWQGFSEQEDKMLQSDENISWLIIVSSKQTINSSVLKNVNCGLDSDIVIAYILDNAESHVHFQADSGNSTQNKNPIISEGNDSPSDTECFPPFPENSTVNLKSLCSPTETSVIRGDAFCLLQIYKIRKLVNSSLVVCPLGIWDSTNGTKNLQSFVGIEKRGNFHNFPLIFGNKDLNKILNQDESSEDDEDDSDLNEFTSYFITILNASKIVSVFPKIGKKEITGEWTDLLGAVVSEEVDISSESISKNLERFSDMSFTHDVSTTRRNIYIQPEESNEFRDIFLVPFDNRLIISVVCTGLIFSLAMTVISKISSSRYANDMQYQNHGFLDSIVWCVAIFAQQGTILIPRLYGGQMLVLISLAFTLLIYNSYSAFITSVLSVELTSIRNVDDLLESDYEIGYTRNSQDELYLRSMNLSQLNHIYLRGYLENDVNNVSEGLLKVTRGNYGFFASSHVARRQLLNISNYRCRFNIDELPIKNTVDHLAFVTAKRSPYKKLINLSIIKMYETGVYKYIYSLIQPDLPKCEKKKTYQSARLVDLSTAFSILILGHIIGVVFLVGECIWNRKKEVFTYLRKKVSNTKFSDAQSMVVLDVGN